MPLKAIIDLGTNTFHLLIADELRQIMHEEKKPVKLGAGGINNGIITAERMGCALQCINNFKQTCNEFGVATIQALGTSALRNAINAREFIQQVLSATGIGIEIISGDAEAKYIYQGAREAVDLGKEKSLLMDIGGGSVEFIIANEKEIFWKKSIEVGGQRLLERFHRHEPILVQELLALNDYLTEALLPLAAPLKQYNPLLLIGSSGSFETLSDIYCVRKNIPNLNSPEGPLSLEVFYEIYNDLVGMNQTERVNMPGMMEWRAEMIVVTCSLIKLLLKLHPFNQIKVSRYSLKEGVLFG